MSQVVDANLSVALVLATSYSPQAQRLWNRWDAAAADVFAPDLWAYEVTPAGACARPCRSPACRSPRPTPAWRP